MKSQIQLSSIIMLIIFLVIEFSSTAQIQDIKKNSNDNKTNNSKSSSSNNNSSSSDIGEDIASGCFSSLFEMMAGCIFSGRDNTENDNNFVITEPNNDINNNLIEEQNLNNADSLVILNKIPEDNVVVENPAINNNQIHNTPKEPAEFSLDFKANFAIGFEPSSEKTYKYYNFLPGLRANLAWFAIDYRYNLLTEFSQDLPDAFKTWDLVFLFNIKASDNAKFSLGAGLHHEEYSKSNFFEFYGGVKIGLSQNRDYLDIDGRLSTDSNDPDNPDDDEFPFSEVGIHYNKRFINSKNLNGYFSVGGIYQNYYSSTDIWAFTAGIIINWHK